jgi:hypothetical protein
VVPPASGRKNRSGFHPSCPAAWHPRLCATPGSRPIHKASGERSKELGLFRAIQTGLDVSFAAMSRALRTIGGGPCPAVTGALVLHRQVEAGRPRNTSPGRSCIRKSRQARLGFIHLAADASRCSCSLDTAGSAGTAQHWGQGPCAAIVLNSRLPRGGNRAITASSEETELDKGRQQARLLRPWDRKIR